MNLRPEMGLTFDDVLLVPKRSRHPQPAVGVYTSSWLVPGVRMAIPVISANMDTVTEARWQLPWRKPGGSVSFTALCPSSARPKPCGASSVQRVLSWKIRSPSRQTPLWQTPGTGWPRRISVGWWWRMTTVAWWAAYPAGYLLAPSGSMLVQEVMTPRSRLIVAPADEPLDAARLALHEHRIEKLPLVDAEDRVVGLITAQDIVKMQEHPDATKDSRGRLRVGVAVGVRRTIWSVPEHASRQGRMCWSLISPTGMLTMPSRWCGG